MAAIIVLCFFLKPDWFIDKIELVNKLRESESDQIDCMNQTFMIELLQRSHY